MKSGNPSKCEISDEELISIASQELDDYGDPSYSPCMSQEEWDDMERAALQSEPPELPKEFLYENWIPFDTVSPTFFEAENDEEVKVISWDNGILISHIPMLCTLEHFFFSRLVHLDFDDAVDLCLTATQRLEPDFKRNFFLKLTEEISYRTTRLLPFVGNEEKIYEKSEYGVSNLIAYSKLNSLWQYFLNRISGNGIPLPLSGLPKLNLTTIQVAEIFGPAIVNGDFGDIHEDKAFKFILDAFQVPHDSENLKFQPFLLKIFRREKFTLPLIDKFIEKSLARFSGTSFKTNVYKNKMV
jgi:hypothetical protein